MLNAGRCGAASVAVVVLADEAVGSGATPPDRPPRPRGTRTLSPGARYGSSCARACACRRLSTLRAGADDTRPERRLPGDRLRFESRPVVRLPARGWERRGAGVLYCGHFGSDGMLSRDHTMPPPTPELPVDAGRDAGRPPLARTGVTTGAAGCGLRVSPIGRPLGPAAPAPTPALPPGLPPCWAPLLVSPPSMPTWWMGEGGSSSLPPSPPAAAVEATKGGRRTWRLRPPVPGSTCTLNATVGGSCNARPWPVS